MSVNGKHTFCKASFGIDILAAGLIGVVVEGGCLGSGEEERDEGE